MDEPIKVDDIVDYSGFFDLSKYKLCFTADNEPVYVPMGESIDEAESPNCVRLQTNGGANLYCGTAIND